MEGHQAEHLKSAGEEIIAKLMLRLMIGAGLIIIGLAAMFAHSLRSFYDPPLQHWEVWELAALLWTFFFIFYYHFTFPPAENESVNRFVSWVLLFLLVILTSLAGYCVFSHHGYAHVLCVTGIVTLLLALDLLLWRVHKAPHLKRAFYESVIVADVPVVAAFGVLVLYQYRHGNIEHPDIFFAGAISFQLLVSNFIFILTQTGVLRGGPTEGPR